MGFRDSFYTDFDQALIGAKTLVNKTKKIHYIYQDYLTKEYMVRQSYIETPSSKWFLLCETGCYL